MRWRKASLILLSVALLSATMPMPLDGTAAALDNYAAREMQTPDLAQFTGGFHGVIITLVVLVLVVWLVLELTHYDVEVHRRPDAPEPRP
jgi:uncharacterized membrane protein